MAMNTMLVLTVAITIAVGILSIVIYPIHTGRNIFAPPRIKGSHDHLHTAKVIHLTGATGAESIAFDGNGDGPYTGVSDGRILKWQGDSVGWTDFAFTSSSRQDCVRPLAPEMEHICGRPLGLRFEKKTGDLYIADAYFGLLVVGPEGGLARQLVTEAESQPLHFTNDLDIDEFDDAIYLTDSSTRFQRRQFLAAVLSGDSTGRLMKYDKSTKEVTVLLRGLAFANGVALSKNRSFLLVAETTTCRIIRFWLKGPKAGNHDVFAILPGFPDNIRRNSKGEFWVGLHSKKGVSARIALSYSWVGNTLLKLPLSFKQLHSTLIGGKAHGTAVKVSENGEVMEVVEDSEGKTLKLISEVEEKDGKLWIGSVLMPFVGVYDLQNHS